MTSWENIFGPFRVKTAKQKLYDLLDKRFLFTAVEICCKLVYSGIIIFLSCWDNCKHLSLYSGGRCDHCWRFFKVEEHCTEAWCAGLEVRAGQG